MIRSIIKVLPFFITTLVASDNVVKFPAAAMIDRLEVLRHGSNADMQKAYTEYQKVDISQLQEKKINVYLRGFCKLLSRLGKKEEIAELIHQHQDLTILIPLLHLQIY